MTEHIEQSIDRAIPAIRDRISETFDPEAIYLFGSAARGDTREWSDIDILVVMDVEEKQRYSVIAEIRGVLWEVEVPIDVLLLTPDEFIRDRDRLGTLAELVVKEGRRIYGE